MLENLGMSSRSLTWCTCGAVLTFEYDETLPPLRRLIHLSNRAQWNTEAIDWDRALPDRPGPYERVLEWHGIWRSDYIRRLPRSKQEALARQMVAVEFSQILHGEQAAMMLAGQLTGSVDDLDARVFAAHQAQDEARHVLAIRGLVERIGPIYPCGPVLKQNLNQLLGSPIWPKQVLGLQLFLEARALLSFREHLLFVRDDVFKDVITRVERDEAHHVAFGVQYLRRGIEALDEDEKREVTDYVGWLDANLWSMTQKEEFRQAFEQVDLDYDECFRQLNWGIGGQLSLPTKKSVDAMHHQFGRWFERMLVRVGLEDALPKRAFGEAAPEVSAREVLPWIAVAEGGESQ